MTKNSEIKELLETKKELENCILFFTKFYCKVIKPREPFLFGSQNALDKIEEYHDYLNIINNRILELKEKDNEIFKLKNGE